MLSRFQKTCLAGASFAFILLGLAFYILTHGQQIAQSKATEAFNSVLQPLGFEPLHIGDTHFTWGKVVFRKLTAVAPTGDKTKPHHLSIDCLKVTITPWDLIRQRLSTVKIKGFRLVISPEGRPLDWDKLIASKRSSSGSIKGFHVHDAIIETTLASREVKIPISLDASSAGSDSYADLHWGKPNTPTPNGILHMVLIPPHVEAILTAHNTNIDLDGVTATIPKIGGKLKATSATDISGTFSADIKSVGVQGLAHTTQPFILDSTLEKSSLNATLMAGNETLLSAKGNLTLYPVPESKVQLDGSIRNLGSLITFEGSKVPPSGELSIKGDLLNPVVTLNKIDITMGGFKATGLNSTIKLVSLFPFTTAPYQHVTAHTMELGVFSLKDNDVEFSVNAQRGLGIHRYTAQSLGGKVEAHSFIPTKDGMTFEAAFKAIDLNQLLSLAQLNGVKAEGNISGSASLLYSKKNGIDLTGAEIKSVSDQGRLQLTTNTKDNVAFEALEDLHFTLLDVKIRPSTINPGNLEAAVKILGSNPNVLNSYPFEFNITANGKLKDLVVNTITSLTSPRDMKEVSKKLDQHRDSKRK